MRQEFNKMEIRRAAVKDLAEILAIYQLAREEMRRFGNPCQWGESYPPPEIVEQYIAEGNTYVITDGSEIAAVFVFQLGEEPTYQKIEDGAWPNQEPYGTIHRLASSGRRQGIFGLCTGFCETRIKNIRADTHACNRKMQHLLERNGYVACGRIYVADGSPRIAYQKEERRI